MTATRQATIWCDGCGKHEQSEGTISEVRKFLREKGWWQRSTHAQDLCPDCNNKSGGQPSKFIRTKTFT